MRLGGRIERFSRSCIIFWIPMAFSTERWAESSAWVGLDYGMEFGMSRNSDGILC
jgi:hypothetical protein